MRSAILLTVLIAAAAAEAPYHLPRPAAHAPSFGYAQQAQHLPSLPPPPPPPSTIQLHQAPQSHYHPAPQVFHPQPAPQTLNTHFGYNYPQPTPQPQIQFHPQIQVHHHPAQVQPQIAHYAPPQPAPLPPTVSFTRPQVYQQPTTFYSQYQGQQSYTPQIRPLPAFVAPQQLSPIVYYQQPQQFGSDQGYSYQQPQNSQIPFISQLPLQSQSLSNIGSSSLSSYQADTNQYNTAAQSQTHREVLDSTVVNQVQSIIKDSEHTAAREAGFLSLVSGVSLENAKPSIEISSFVHNSPLSANSAGSSSFSSSSSSFSSLVADNPSGSYGLPTTGASQSSSGSVSQSFLPQSKPGTSYGPPN